MNSLEALRRIGKSEHFDGEYVIDKDYECVKKDLEELQQIKNSSLREGLEILTNITNGNGYDWFEQRILKIDKLKTILKNASALEEENNQLKQDMELLMRKLPRIYGFNAEYNRNHDFSVVVDRNKSLLGGESNE